VSKDNNAATLTAYRGTDKTLVVPAKITIAGTDYAVATISAYFGNTTIKKVVFAAGCAVTKLDSYAFAGCVSLKEIHIPDTVTIIASRVFSGCSSLTDIVLPSVLTAVSEYTFYNCVSLAEITVPENVATIGNGAFYGCARLTRVLIEFSAVNALGNNAFYLTDTDAERNLRIVVPDVSAGTFASQWTAVSDSICSDRYLIGDFIVKYNAAGTEWTLLQYSGDADEVDFTKLTLNGLYVTAIAENAVIGDRTVFTVGKDTTYYDGIKDRIKISED
jgi:hypothetical protein